MALKRRLLLTLTGALAFPAQARDQAPRAIGDWTVSASKDGKGCFLTRDYDANGRTTLLLGVDTDDTNRLSLLNANWSIKPKEKLQLTFRLSNSSYPAHFAIGIASDGKQGFVTGFGTKFPAYFATSKSLEVTRGDVPVARLGLDRADDAVAALQKCVDGQRANPAPADDKAAPDKAQTDGIPKDPFAPAPRRDSKSAKRAKSPVR